MAEIPLYRRDGSVRAVTVVDDTDHEWLSRWRWCWANGYARRIEEREGVRRYIYMARLLMNLSHGDPRQVDHRDKNRLNNHRDNLRITAGAIENGQNVPGRKKTSRYRGVYWRTQRSKWAACASLTVDGHRRRFYFGLFDDEEEAAQAARSGRQKIMPFSEDDHIPDANPL